MFGGEAHDKGPLAQGVGALHRGMQFCPVCRVVLPAEDLEGQRDHMNTEHPAFIDLRMREAGFMRDPFSGAWIDTLGRHR